jgi:hypothetical protein
MLSTLPQLQVPIIALDSYMHSSKIDHSLATKSVRGEVDEIAEHQENTLGSEVGACRASAKALS